MVSSLRRGWLRGARQVREYRPVGRDRRTREQTATQVPRVVRPAPRSPRRLLRFVTDPAVPFDNNGSERTIRMPKLRVKVSGSMRTTTGAEHFAAIRSYIATATRHGINTLDALIQTATGNPWIPTPA
jgi:hypothetical protein